MAGLDIVNAYLAAFYVGDFARARTLLVEDFHYKGSFVEADGRDAFLASAARLASIAKGHRLLRQWSDGDEICSIYDVDLETPTTKGSVTMSEWHSLRDGKLAASRLVLDSAAFRSLVPAA